MMGDKKRVTVEVDPELHRKAKTKAASEGRTIADVVREFLSGWAEREGEQAQPQARERKARK